MILSWDRAKWMPLVGLACLLSARTAAAQSNPTSCTNDVDCVATPQCGGDICDWSNATSPMKCRAAGTGPKGMDGWCTTDTDCKCHSLGATCVNAQCTFTRPCDAPDAGGCTTTGAGGSSGSAGSSGGGGGGCNVGGGSPPSDAVGLLGALGLLISLRRRRG